MSALIAAGFVGAVAIILVGLDRLAGRVVRPTIQPVEHRVEDLGSAFEELFIESGRHRLHAWLLEGVERRPGAPVLILAHGWGANHGVVLRLAGPLTRRGHDVVLFDVRGHGDNPSVGEVTIKEFRDDVLAAVLRVRELVPHGPVVLIGHSMGGAAGVLAAAEGAPIDGLILIAAPSDVLRVTAEYLTDHGKPGTFFVNLLRPFFWRRVGGSFLPLTPSRRIGEVTVPLLIIQPENDTRVVRPHAERLATAAGIPYHLVRDHEHIDVLEAPETLRLVEEFLSGVESKAAHPPG